MFDCPNLPISSSVMEHIVRVESGFNPYAIGVVGAGLVRQPRNLAEAVVTAENLKKQGYNFSLGLAQINRYNLEKYGLNSFEKAFQSCDNLQAGANILESCLTSAKGNWGKAFSCYYSGNFTTGYRHGYVQKILDSVYKYGDEFKKMLTQQGHFLTTSSLDYIKSKSTTTRPIAVIPKQRSTNKLSKSTANRTNGVMKAVNDFVYGVAEGGGNKSKKDTAFVF